MIDINLLIKQAMIEKDPALPVYRAIKTEIMNFKTAKNAEIYDEVAEIKLLQKMVKQREDAKKQYLEAGREDLATNEGNELEVLQKLLPAPVKVEEIENYLMNWCIQNKFFTFNIKNGISTKCLYVPKSMLGRAISLLKEHFPTADGKQIADMVKKCTYNEKACLSE